MAVLQHLLDGEGGEEDEEEEGDAYKAPPFPEAHLPLATPALDPC